MSASDRFVGCPEPARPHWSEPLNATVEMLDDIESLEDSEAFVSHDAIVIATSIISLGTALCLALTEERSPRSAPPLSAQR